LSEKFYNSLKIGPKFFPYAFQKLINFQFCEICGYKKGMTKIFSHLSFVAVFGFWIQDPGSGMGKNQDQGSGIQDKHPGSATLVICLF
jgi:hypothetical protein